MMDPNKIWTYDELDIHTVTNIFLYGKETTPSFYQDRLRSKADYDALPVDGNGQKFLTIKLDAVSYMSDGPGRYASPSQAPFVEQFFSGLITLPDGVYTRAQLQQPPYGVSENDFKISISQHELYKNTPDYNSRTYVFHDSGFILSEDTEFIVTTTGVSMSNVKVRPYDDDFDFNTDGFFEDLADYLVLETQIDPYAMGVKLDIKFENKDSIIPNNNYDYLTDVQTYLNNDNGSLVFDAWPAMNQVVADLKAAGTIDYETASGGKIVYGSAVDDASLGGGTINGDVLVSGDGNDRLIATRGFDALYGGNGTDSVDYTTVGAFLKVLSVPNVAGDYTVDKYYGQTSATGPSERDVLYSIEDIVGNTVFGMTIDGVGGVFVQGAGLILPQNYVASVFHADPHQAVTLRGTEYGETLSGSTQADYIDGRDGNDIAYGGGGNDTYAYCFGADQDVFDDQGGLITDIDTLLFKCDVDFSDLTFTRHAANTGVVVITMDGFSGTLSLHSQLWMPIDYLKFQDGSVIDMETVLVKVQGTFWNDFLTGTTDNGAYREGALIHDELYGYEGNDILQGSTGIDKLYGGDHNDNLQGGTGGDYLYGEAGVDTLQGETGDDFLYGGDGNDFLHGNQNNDTYDGGVGNDEMRDYGDGNDIYIFDNGSDLIEDAYGIDTLQMKAATINDVSITAQGNGDLLVVGGGGQVTIKYFNDVTYKIENIAFSDGTMASLLTYATWVRGTAASDTLLSTSSQPVIGYDGDDTLSAGGLNPLIGYGGNGNDTFVGGAANDSFYGQGGRDTASYANAGSAVTVNLATTTAQNTGGGGSDLLSSIENLIGSAFNDVLTGDVAVNSLTGGDGNDTLNGGDGDDVLEGGAGTDVLNGGLGFDTVRYASATAAVTVSLALTTAQNTLGAGTDTLSSISHLVGSGFNDTLTGNGDDNTIEGGTGNDALNGGAGFDTASYASSTAGVTVNLSLTGVQNTVGAGSDTLSAFENILGSGFNDTLTGDGNANVIEGGLGNDVLNGGAGTDVVSYRGAGAGVSVSLALTGVQNTGGAGSDTLSNFERIIGSSFNDTLTGNSGTNQIEGGLGNDIMDGGTGTDTLAYQTAASGVSVNLSITAAQNTLGAGTDTISNFESITGSGFDDILYGNSGTNTLKGGNGNDILCGSAGTDSLYGDAGADIFLFESATAFSGIDTIFDFSTAQSDKLNIANLLIGYTPLQSVINDFVTFTTAGANTTFAVDRDGSGTTHTIQTIATLNAITGFDANTLLTNGNLVVV